MKSARSLAAAYLLFSLLAFCAAAQTNKITAREAKDRVREVQTVCGKVVSTHFAERSKGQPTFLDLDEPYPKEIFTILIWGSDRAKFGGLAAAGVPQLMGPRRRLLQTYAKAITEYRRDGSKKLEEYRQSKVTNENTPRVTNSRIN